MFPYFGAKRLNQIKYYPEPSHNTIIEPFAGSARYSFNYWQKEIILYDIDPMVCNVWKYLQKSTPGSILKLPDIGLGEQIPDYLNDEEKWLIGMSIAVTDKPRKTATTFNHWNYKNRYISKYYNNSANPKKSVKWRIAINLHKIKHWKIYNKDYREIKNNLVTWFIDAPYQVGGSRYKFNKIDYSHLSRWIQKRNGQVIVCENSSATWQDFKLLYNSSASRFSNKEECILTFENNF